ncbi:MAG TPA: aminotransferase class I/II-fold pyridoxal phosphate-dependent enzyme [Gemmatimonadales bacterium]|nr:aminotransferase class I/II-fold pyridoxal phosphate-dependent enzyme [Gemmatimonadales bacterium]
MNQRKQHFDTLAAHGGVEAEPVAGGLTPPIHLSSTYAREADGSYSKGYEYGRADNPTRHLLERTLAQLEGGAAAFAFSSGQASVHALLAALKPGDRVVMPSDVYHGVRTMARDLFGPWGLQVEFADLWDEAAAARAVTKGTRLVWAETPSNPLLRVTDLSRLAEICRAAGATLAVDNTWATPALQRPLELGADVVMHSTTKYLSGHGDVLGGALVFRAADEFYGRVKGVLKMVGSMQAPFDAWLVLRGIRSLAPRMRAHCENAQLIAEFLSARQGVTAVHYPGLESHPQHAVAMRQMTDTGGMLSIQVAGGREGAMRVFGRTKLFTRATSLGSTESLIEHRRSVEGPHSTTPDDLLRLSIGVEHPADLIDDLDQALG